MCILFLFSFVFVRRVSTASQTVLLNGGDNEQRMLVKTKAQSSSYPENCRATFQGQKQKASERRKVQKSLETSPAPLVSPLTFGDRTF